MSRSQNGGADETLLTSKKAAPTIYSVNGGVDRITWTLDYAADLDESVTRSIPAEISIDVSVLYQRVDNKDVAKGYIFSNPMLRVKDSTQQIVIEGIFFQINGQPIPSQTSFTAVSRVVSGTVPIPLMPNVNANTLIAPISTTDVFQLYIRRITPTAGYPDAPPPLTPILRISDTVTNSEVLVQSADVRALILRDAGITRWCLSESPVAPASTEAICQNSLVGPGSVNGWSLTRPNTFKLSAGDGSKTIYLWVADQNLNINVDPAMTTVTVDTAAPSAATIQSVFVSDSQVADLSVTHPNEADVAGWCVFEQNSIKAPPASVPLTDNCWKWTDNFAKPTTVGFKDGGSRDIWIYVRDKAGNISAPSNKRTANNTFGAINYSQLVDPAGGPRAIFRNNCYTCHGTNANPGFNKLQLFEYGEALRVAKAGILVNRTNNPISPMPNINNGLMSQRNRDLIRLWTFPEDVGEDPLP
jgi:mono/diheme cytochrome c family protein